MKTLTDIDDGVLRRVDWLEVFPATLFFRAFSLTFAPTYIFLGALALAFCATLFYGGVEEAAGRLPLSGSRVRCELFSGVDGGRAFCDFAFRSHFETSDARSRTYDGGSNATRVVLYHALGFLACSWLALAFSRSTVVRLTTSSRSSLIASFRFATKKLPSAILAAFLPCLAACLFAVFALICGFSGWLAPFALVALFAVAALLLIFTMSFPLATTAIAADNSDGFDATSRGISYATQRFLPCLLYVALGFALAFFGAGLVGRLCFAVDALYHNLYFNLFHHSSNDPWLLFFRLVIFTAPASYFFFAMIAYFNTIYVLLRRSVDGAPYDECVLNLSGARPRRLRKILDDMKGAPTFEQTDAQIGDATDGGGVEK